MIQFYGYEPGYISSSPIAQTVLTEIIKKITPSNLFLNEFEKMLQYGMLTNQIPYHGSLPEISLTREQMIGSFPVEFSIICNEESTFLFRLNRLLSNLAFHSNITEESKDIFWAFKITTLIDTILLSQPEITNSIHSVIERDLLNRFEYWNCEATRAELVIEEAESVIQAQEAIFQFIESEQHNLV